MKLIIGLGNPGEEYKNNRHNVGFMVIDKLKTLNSKQILIFKSQNFMNESGEFVKKLIDQYKLNISDLWIIHDDLDIPLGSYKIQFGIGPKVHKGINSVEDALGTNDFWRVRIGIENRAEKIGKPTFAKAMVGEKYVLQDFTKEERKILDQVVERICKEISRLRE